MLSTISNQNIIKTNAFSAINIIAMQVLITVAFGVVRGCRCFCLEGWVVRGRSQWN